MRLPFCVARGTDQSLSTSTTSKPKHTAELAPLTKTRSLCAKCHRKLHNAEWPNDIRDLIKAGQENARARRG
jgi:hypothetical protein